MDEIEALKHEVERWKKQATEYRDFLDATSGLLELAKKYIAEDKAMLKVLLEEMEADILGPRPRQIPKSWPELLRRVIGDG